MHNPDKCPFCGSSKIIPGRIQASEGEYGFKPDQSDYSLFSFRTIFAFAFGPAARYCADCSMVWAKADAQDAAKFIRKFGTDALKAQLAATPQAQPPRF